MFNMLEPNVADTVQALASTLMFMQQLLRLLLQHAQANCTSCLDYTLSMLSALTPEQSNDESFWSRGLQACSYSFGKCCKSSLSNTLFLDLVVILTTITVLDGDSLSYKSWLL